jgi:3-hydroxyisobutyrate dehydrogenase
MASDLLSRPIGFIGLGAMGRPMVVNLTKKLPPGSKLRVHDVVDAAMDDFASIFPTIVVKCSSAREVAESSVSLSISPETFAQVLTRTGYRFYHVA